MVCVNCRRFLRPIKTGVRVEEMRPHGGDWLPYQLWNADLYQCPECRVQIVGGFPLHPVSEHYRDDYQERKAELPPLLQVEDCGPRHAGPWPLKG